MIEYNINMREEIFGSTLLNLKNGQREYLDKSETKKILEEGTVDFVSFSYYDTACLTKRKTCDKIYKKQ